MSITGCDEETSWFAALTISSNAEGSNEHCTIAFRNWRFWKSAKITLRVRFASSRRSWVICTITPATSDFSWIIWSMLLMISFRSFISIVSSDRRIAFTLSSQLLDSRRVELAPTVIIFILSKLARTNIHPGVLILRLPISRIRRLRKCSSIRKKTVLFWWVMKPTIGFSWMKRKMKCKKSLLLFEMIDTKLFP